MSDQPSVDLAAFRSAGVRVFAGRDRGREVRRAADLESLDSTSAGVRVLVPLDTISVNSSFFLGLFGPSIRKLGADGFCEHYRFEGREIRRTIEACVEEALNPSSPL